MNVLEHVVSLVWCLLGDEHQNLARIINQLLIGWNCPLDPAQDTLLGFISLPNPLPLFHQLLIPIDKLADHFDHCLSTVGYDTQHLM